MGGNLTFLIILFDVRLDVLHATFSKKQAEKRMEASTELQKGYSNHYQWSLRYSRQVDTEETKRLYLM